MSKANGGMQEQDLKLAEGFDGHDSDAWQTAVSKVLKGGDFAKRLVSRTSDGIAVQPLYMQQSEAAVIAGNAAGTPWRVTQRIDHPDPNAANKQALQDLQGGANGLALVPASSFASRGFGIEGLSTPVGINAVLADVGLDMISLRIEPTVEGPAIARGLMQCVEVRNIKPANTNIEFGLAPLANLMSFGMLPDTWNATTHELAETLAELKTRGYTSPALSCDVRPINEAGGSEAQELAVAIASGVAYLRALEGHGVALKDIADTISFTIAIDAGQFEGLAKLRALRQLWARVLTASGLPQKPAHVHAETAWRMLTKHDAAVNMLRATLAVFSAGVGGADSISVLPHTSAIGLPDSFARRIARNTQNILIEESNLWRVVDPAAGAGALASLTDELAHTAWGLFQEIEREGGIVASLENDLLQERIATIAETRWARLATRHEPITGTSEFPQLDEPSGGILDVNRQEHTQLTGGAILARPLPSQRLSEPFEALRKNANSFQEKNGKRPQIFLANLGTLAEHTTRTTWIKNLLAVGGIEAIVGEGVTNAADAGQSFAQSGASLACICSNDENYELFGEAVTGALKGAGAMSVYVAGKPSDELRKAGVDNFWHVGIDALTELQKLHTTLKIDPQ